MSAIIWTIFVFAIIFSALYVLSKIVGTGKSDGATHAEMVASAKKVGSAEMAIAMFLCHAVTFWGLFIFGIIIREIFG